MGVYYKLGLHLTLVGTGIFISCSLISMHKLIIVAHAFLNTLIIDVTLFLKHDDVWLLITSGINLKLPANNNNNNS